MFGPLTSFPFVCAIFFCYRLPGPCYARPRVPTKRVLRHRWQWVSGQPAEGGARKRAVDLELTSFLTAAVTYGFKQSYVMCPGENYTALPHSNGEVTIDDEVGMNERTSFIINLALVLNPPSSGNAPGCTNVWRSQGLEINTFCPDWHSTESGQKTTPECCPRWYSDEQSDSWQNEYSHCIFAEESHTHFSSRRELGCPSAAPSASPSDVPSSVPSRSPSLVPTDIPSRGMFRAHPLQTNATYTL